MYTACCVLLNRLNKRLLLVINVQWPSPGIVLAIVSVRPSFFVLVQLGLLLFAKLLHDLNVVLQLGHMNWVDGK